tara:strand:- start:143 stop:376 length:234 start_codon:yes stop_codon:yes gene_type:complete
LLDASSGFAKDQNKRRTPLVVAAEKVSPAVVNIYTSETGRSFVILLGILEIIFLTNFLTISFLKIKIIKKVWVQESL